MEQNTSGVRLKLVIDRETERVLYGEADKKFIDFLFNILSLPLGAAITVLKKDGIMGCLGNLYDSIENLNESCLKPNVNRDEILKPKDLFKRFPSYVSYSLNAFCPGCNGRLTRPCTYVTPPNQPTPGGGFVKDLTTYIVMDDLTFKHISDFSITTFFKDFNIKDVGSLEEKLITLDVNQGMELLEASLQSKTVLTNVFLERQ